MSTLSLLKSDSPVPDFFHSRHTDLAEGAGAYIAYGDTILSSPNSSVWMIPGTWREDQWA